MACYTYTETRICSCENFSATVQSLGYKKTNKKKKNVQTILILNNITIKILFFSLLIIFFIKLYNNSYTQFSTLPNKNHNTF